MKPAKIGTVYTAKARLFSRDGKLIGRCIDTPNAIARAMMENAEISMAIESSGRQVMRTEYASRMADWNVAISGFQPA